MTDFEKIIEKIYNILEEKADWVNDNKWAQVFNRIYHNIFEDIGPGDYVLSFLSTVLLDAGLDVTSLPLYNPNLPTGFLVNTKDFPDKWQRGHRRLQI